MSAKHTPGPWMAHGPAKPTPDAQEGGDWCIQDGGTNVIAEAFYRVNEGVGGTRDAEANARLIAAAPDLLEALREIANDYADRFDMASPSTNPGMKYVVSQARAAIAKAEGQ